MFDKKFLFSFVILFSLFFTSIPTSLDAAGLVPCGTTSNPERCTICHLFVLMNNIMIQLRNWIFITAVVIIAIAGIIYIVSVGNESMTSMAKTAIKSVLIGSGIILVAWLAISSLLLAMAVKDSAVSDAGVGLIFTKNGNIITGWEFKCGP